MHKRNIELQSVLATFNKLDAAVERRNLTDGYQCHCSTSRCSPFIWMMKGMWTFQKHRADICVNRMFSYYSNCGPELTILTYAAAIRYMTFEALGLMHTCCDTYSLARGEKGWVEIDDVDMINEEQAPLLEMHEELVAEFGKKSSCVHEGWTKWPPALP